MAWRSVLATGVASTALFAYSGRPVRAQTVPPAPPCNTISGIGGSIVTCSGNVSTGVLLSNGGGPFEVLNVTNLTADIAPASGITGIEFTSNGAVELNVAPGPFSIFATEANGIFAASNGGTVTISSTADIITTGGSATGVQGSAQDSLLTITSSGDIATSGNNSFGIAAGTVYGDIIVNSSGDIATTGTFAAGINVGTIGSLGTTQGAITINSTGDVATSGTSAIGINAASVYGPVTINSTGDIAVSGSGSIGINVQTQGLVEVTSTGDIATGPNSSVGISALSQSDSVLLTSTGDIETAGHNGIGIYARAGEVAFVMASGSITTHGDGAAGIAASGDTGAVVLSTANIRTFGDDAPGITVMADGDAMVASSGDITTSGDSSDGINVVSVDGMVGIVNAGNIRATGSGSAGIYAEGYSGTSVINFGAITGCPCGGVVLTSAMGDNNLVNFGTITADIDASAIDMATANGANLVENFGTVTGNVSMAGATGVFENRAGALFNSGDTVIGSVSNDGTLAPGGSGTVETTFVGGGFTQSRSGVFAVDVDGGTADRINVLETAQLSGEVVARLLTLPALAAQSYLILQADSGVTDNGLNVTASPVLHATLSYPNPNDVVLGISVDFIVDGLNPNQRAIAINLNEIFAAGVGGLGPVLLGLVNTADTAEVKSALDQLSPEIYSDAQIAALYSNLAFNGSLMSCKVNGTDTASIIREGQCLWAGASARFLDTSTTFQQIGFNETAGLFTAGVQVALDDVWRLGVAGGYQSSTISTGTGASSEGNLGQAGIALKYNPGPLLLAGALSGGGGRYETRRVMSFGSFSGVAEGDQDLGIFSGALRAAYVLGSPHLYLKPSVDSTLTYLDLGGFNESGGNGAALSAAGQGQTVFSVAPMVESGTEFWLGNGTLVRPLIRGGAIWYDNADFALDASFSEAPAGVSPFTIRTDMDEVMGLVGAGIDVISGTDAVLRFSYDAQLGETTQIHAVGVKGSARF
jgi:uncharacterized protein with beta-barrel porin domain